MYKQHGKAKDKITVNDKANIITFGKHKGRLVEEVLIKTFATANITVVFLADVEACR